MEPSSSRSPSSDLCKLFVGGIKHVKGEELRDYFSRFGEVKDVVALKDKATGGVRAFGFVEFSDPDSAESSLRQREHVIGGIKVDVKRARPRAGRCWDSCNNENNPARLKKIFVGGLPSFITEEEFRSYFEQFGRVIDLVIMRDSLTRCPRGFGFITFEKVEAADTVLRQKFHELNGKHAEVKIAIPKDYSNQNFCYSDKCGIGGQRGPAVVNHPAEFYSPYSSRYGVYDLSFAPPPGSYYEAVGYGGGYNYGGLVYCPPYSSARIPWSPVAARSPFIYGNPYGYTSYTGMNAGGGYPAGCYMCLGDDKSNQNGTELWIMEDGPKMEDTGGEKLEALQEF